MSRISNPNRKFPREILIIKPSSLGDIVHGLLVAASIKAQLPGARISWVARDIFAPLVRTCAAVDHVYEFHRGGGFAAFLRLIREIRLHEFDVVLDMQGLARSGVLALCAAGERKLVRADGREGSRFLVREKPALPANYPRCHAVEILLQFLPTLGLRPEILDDLHFFPADISPSTEAALHVPDATAGAIVLFLESRRPEKQWGGFRELTGVLLARFPRHKIIWAGQTNAEYDFAWEGTGRFFNLVGRTTLPEVAYIIKRAALVVCNDSAPLHLAAALHTPVLGIFGPTPPELYGPYPASRDGNRVIVAPEKNLKLLSAASVASEIARML